MTDRKIISQSEYGAWRKCGEYAHRVYVLGDRGSPPTPEAVRGRVVHKSACINLRSKRDGETPLGMEEAQELTANVWDDSVETEGIRFSGKEMEEGHKVVEERERERAIALGGLHADKLVPQINPKYVEEDFTSEKPLGILGDQYLRGVLDLVDVPYPAANPDTVVIRDLKTAKCKASPFDVLGSLQLVVSSILYRLKHGVRPDGARLDVLVRTKGGKKTEPKLYVQEGLPVVYVDEKAEARVLESMGRVTAMREKGIIPPPAVTGMDWFCSCKWCPFTGDCRFYNRSADANAR